MTDLTAQERLQPSLLDRLTDTDPENRSEPRERRVLSFQRLKAGVLRDLAWLLSTGYLETFEDLEAYPHARSSVVNYGLPDLTGVSVANMDSARLEKVVREAIVRFEPRINQRTLKVQVTVDRDRMHRNAMTFRIEGELWAQPVPLSLLLRTELDLETGNVDVREG
jgi:type VI secretion system protein ImpF